MLHASKVLIFGFAALLASGRQLAIAENPVAANGHKGLPSQALQDEAKKLIRDIHRSDFDQAKTPAQKVSLAKMLIEEGANTGDDKAGQYVLFQMAADLAIEVGDREVGFDAADHLADHFFVPPYPIKLAIVTAAEKTSRTPKDRLALFAVVDELTAQMMRDNQYDLAKKAATIALSLARGSQDLTAVKTATARQQEVLANEKAFQKVQEASEVLAKTPDDQVANAAVGKFTCLVKQDWDRGLLMLLKGNDAAWQRLADKDIARPTSSEDRLDLGDGWWALADGLKGEEQKVVRQRAAYWYQQALPELTGLAKTKAANRIAEAMPANKAAAEPLVLVITANVRGVDKVEITKKGATWSKQPAPKGGTYEVATKVTIAGKAWNVKDDPTVSFDDLDPILAARIAKADFKSVEMVKKKARGNVEFVKSKDGCVILMHDPQPESDTYEFEVRFKR